METPFGITREEVLNLAAEKLANDYANEEDLGSTVREMIKTRVTEAFASNLNTRIDGMLCEEMEKLLGQEICPVDIYGERTGTPTTMRAVLAERARVFWDTKVNSDGKQESYGGKPRHEWLFQKIVNEEFSKVVKQNIVNLVGSFKDALSASAIAITKEHIDSLIKVKSLGDR